MNNALIIYPHLTPENCADYAIDIRPYQLSYTGSEGQEIVLDAVLAGSGLDIDISNNPAWSIAANGLRIRKEVRFSNSCAVKGPSGVAPQEAKIKVILVWKNKELTQTGFIEPMIDEDEDSNEVVFSFYKEFSAGEVMGNLELRLTAIIATAAETLHPGEEMLMNREGVSLGELETVMIFTHSNDTEFPIDDSCSDKNKPLWWAEFRWDDPFTEDFSIDSFCICLNREYSLCPVDKDGTIKNRDMLAEILATAYVLAIRKIEENEDAFSEFIVGEGAESGSVADILYRTLDCSGCGSITLHPDYRLIHSKLLLFFSKKLKGRDAE